MFSALFLIFFLAQDIPSYYIVVKPGKLLEVQAEPRYEGKFCYFVMPDGEKGMLPLDSVDLERTKSYNEELAEKLLQEVAAQEAAVSEVTEPEEPKVIKITHRMQIPAYQREETGSTVPQSEAETPQYEGMIGQPKVLTFTKDDALYISKETIIRLATGYRIECEIFSNHPRGVSKASVALSAHFTSGEIENANQTVSPGFIPRNGNAVVGFDLSNTNDLVSSEYTLSYTIGPE